MPELRLKGRVDLDGSRFTAGLTRMNVEAKKFGASLSGVSRAISFISGGLGGLAATAGLGAMYEKTKAFLWGTLQNAIDLKDVVDKTNLSAAQLKDIGKVTGDHGSSLGEAVEMFKHLRQTTREALNGNKELIASYEKLGFTIEQLKAMGFEQVWNKLASRLAGSNMSDSTMEALRQIGGRSADNLIPSFKAGFATISPAKKAEIEASMEELAMLGRRIKEIVFSITSTAKSWLRLGERAEKINLGYELLGLAYRKAMGLAEPNNKPAKKGIDDVARAVEARHAKEQAALGVDEINRKVEEVRESNRFGSLNVGQQIAEMEKKLRDIETQLHPASKSAAQARFNYLEPENEAKLNLEKVTIEGQLAKMRASFAPSDHRGSFFRYAGGYTPSPTMLNDPGGVRAVQANNAKVLQSILYEAKRTNQLLQSMEGPYG